MSNYYIEMINKLLHDQQFYSAINAAHPDYPDIIFTPSFKAYLDIRITKWAKIIYSLELIEILSIYKENVKDKESWLRSCAKMDLKSEASFLEDLYHAINLITIGHATAARQVLQKLIKEIETKTNS